MSITNTCAGPDWNEYQSSVIALVRPGSFERSTSSERVSRHGSSRPPPRRAPTPPPEEEESSPEVVTHQVRAFRALDEEPEDTNETRLPDSEEGALSITTPGAPSLPKRRGGLMIVLVVLALLIIGGGAAVALGLDGGRVSGL
jgi:hypothetical protein